MSLHKIYNFVGYNNLGLILEQERKHWLLKPDAKLNVQDSATGSIFQGKMENLGNEVIVETNKTNAYTGSDMFQFVNDMFNVVLEPLSSALPYNNALNGLMYECIISSKVAYVDNNVTSYKNYKVKFTNCTEVLIPFGDSLETPDVYVGKWIKTTSNPIIMLPDSSNAYTIEIPLQFKSNVTGCTFYYPLEENMQPLSLTRESASVYVTEAVTDNTFIGYPIYWFTSDNTNVGPQINIPKNHTNNKTIFYVANPGDVSKYNTQIFCCVDGDNDATPEGETTDWKVVCQTVTGSFTGTTADVNIPIDMSTIHLVQISTGNIYPIPFVSTNNDTLTLTSINKWYRHDNIAESNMNNYDQNCYNVQHDQPIIPLFNLHLDENVSFLHNTTDVGYAGIHLSSEVYSETTPRYPYSLGEWDGIPEWINDNEEGAPQHTAIYAIHNTPNYNPDDPTSRQTSAIILDPGKQKTSADETFTNDERGRAYLISNDDASYENNATAEYKKPPRTIARICDIPTTLIQLTNIVGLSPTTVVDKRYVHTDACYTEKDRIKLYNTLANRWVRPTNVDADGNPITEHSTSDNDFIFNNESDLNDVDLTHVVNDFCEYENLNPMVDPQYIALDMITDPGNGYKVGDMGIVIIGGASINYTVTELVGEEPSGVKNVTLTPSSNNPISLSNFDLVTDPSGEKYANTYSYGTSPTSPDSGTGLCFSMVIQNYDSIRTKRGKLLDGLFALVKLPDGLWLYQYDNKWIKRTMISEAETSTIISSLGGLSTTESYMTSIVSVARTLSVTSRYDHQSYKSLNVISTPSFINIIDTAHVPYIYDGDKPSVDINKLMCQSIYRGKAKSHSVEFIIDYLKENNRNWYDCYVFWKWDDPSPTSTNLLFSYGIIQRSFNNLMSTDISTMLPMNGLNSPSYVHSNEQTTIVWNTDHGVMMWVYDPVSSEKETYTIDPDTNDISISRKTRTWNDVDLYNNTALKLVGDDGKLLYNIISNNPTQVSYDMRSNDPIYQKPVFAELGTIGQTININPVGVWKLVYPRINTYTFSNGNGLKFDAVKMDILRGDNLGTIGNVKDQNGNVVNKKILIIDRQTNGNAMKVYNSQTNTWDKV